MTPSKGCKRVTLRYASLSIVREALGRAPTYGVGFLPKGLCDLHRPI